jgi:hypothetical protein
MIGIIEEGFGVEVCGFVGRDLGLGDWGLGYDV